MNKKPRGKPVEIWVIDDPVFNKPIDREVLRKWYESYKEWYEKVKNKREN